MKLGILGLPNVGKSTLFNAITKSGAQAENYPFCTIEPNIGIVTVPDERVDKLHEIYNSKKTVHATIEFCDIAGLVKGASKGEGLGNKFLGHVREVDALVHVVRCFENENIVHVSGSINPIDDIETINTELILSDMEILEKRIQKTSKLAKSDKNVKQELEYLKEIMSGLESGTSARALTLTEEAKEFMSSLNLLSNKPIIYVANISEEDIMDSENNKYVLSVKKFAKSEGSECVAISAEIEQELAMLGDDERNEFLSELGASESGLSKLIHASYKLLGLISFLTAGEDEVRAWTISEGSTAPKAAGKIHSDFEKGFIRAETISYESLMECEGHLSIAREKGLMRSEGKEYIVKDGDVMHFLFNV